MDLIVEPGTQIDWRTFSDHVLRVRNAVALDGYVRGPSKLNRYIPAVNFNHHEPGDDDREALFRFSTRSTTAQVALAIRSSLFRLFNRELTHVYVNDCDEDVCTSVFLLRNPDLVTSTVNPALNRLIFMEDVLDSTSGAYQYPVNAPLRRQMAWVYEPYRSARQNRDLSKCSSAVHHAIIDSVCARISDHLMGRGHELALDTRYEVVLPAGSWTMIREIGPYGRLGALADGILGAYVIVQEIEAGRWRYTVGRTSPFVPFNVTEILNSLSAYEPGWGGSDDIGGSPRGTDSKLSPSEVRDIVARVVERT